MDAFFMYHNQFLMYLATYVTGLIHVLVNYRRHLKANYVLNLVGIFSILVEGFKMETIWCGYVFEKFGFPLHVIVECIVMVAFYCMSELFRNVA